MSSSSFSRALAGEATTTSKRSRPALPTPSPQSGSPFPVSSASPSRKKRARLTFDGPLPVSPSPPARFARSPGLTLALRPSSPTPTLSDLPAPLPLALGNLLAFHRALALSLAHTLAAHPPVLPPRSTREQARDPRGLIEEVVLLKGVANWEGLKGIREVVERGAGRKCTGGDLKRLLWLYEWDGLALPTDNATTSSPSDPSNSSGPYLLPSPTTVDSSDEASRSLLSISLTPTRTLSKPARAQTHTYTFNLRLTISDFSGGVVGSIGRWSADQKQREAVVRQRLERWDELGGGSLPMKVLQPLPGTTLYAGSIGAAVLGPPGSPRTSTPSSSRTTHLPTPPQSSHSQSVRRLLFPSPTVGTNATSSPSSSTPPPSSTPTKASASSDRRQSLRDRIAAKEAAAAPLGGLFAAAGIQSTGTGKPAEGRMMSRVELKRRSTLSRLSGVAEAVFMLFTSPSANSSISTSSSNITGSVRRRAIPIDEVCNVLIKSSKTEISSAEARESLQLLSTLTPNFLSLITPASTSQTYVELQGTASAAPVSPGRRIEALGGTGSPGRVLSGRGGGGLREVREAIRRELGERDS